MKKLFCCLFSLLALCLAGCANWDDIGYDPMRELSEYYETENGTGTDYALDSFTLPYFANDTLDPITCIDGCQESLGMLLYEGLYALDAQFVPQPVLVKSAVYDAATLTYTLQMRSDVLFSDGSACTAADAVATLLRAADSSRYGARLAQVERIEGSGYTLTITLKAANSSFLSLLDIPIVKAGTETERIPVGTGPYYVATDEQGAYLAPNCYWQDADELPLSRIELASYKSNEAANYAFASHDIHLLSTDLTGTIPAPGDIASDCTDAPTSILQYIGFNFQTESLQDPAVRKAIAAVIDSDDLINSYLLGHGVATDFPVHPASTLYPTDPDNRSGSSAATAMEKAGLKTGVKQYFLTFIVNNENSFKVAAAEAIAEALCQYDLQVSVLSLPWDSYLEALAEGRYDLYYGEVQLTADWNLMALLSTSGSLNYGGYHDDTMNAALLTYLAAGGDTRKDAMADVCRLFQRDTPIAPICFKSYSVLIAHGIVDAITPAVNNPFYGIKNWSVHLGQ